MNSDPARLERSIDSLRQVLDEMQHDPRADRRLDRMEDRLQRRMDRLQASLDAIRRDLTHIALAGGFFRETSGV